MRETIIAILVVVAAMYAMFYVVHRIHSRPSGDEGLFDELERLRRENHQLGIEIKLLEMEKKQMASERRYLLARAEALTQGQR